MIAQLVKLHSHWPIGWDVEYNWFFTCTEWCLNLNYDASLANQWKEWSRRITSVVTFPCSALFSLSYFVPYTFQPCSSWWRIRGSVLGSSLKVLENCLQLQKSGPQWTSQEELYYAWTYLDKKVYVKIRFKFSLIFDLVVGWHEVIFCSDSYFYIIELFSYNAVYFVNTVLKYFAIWCATHVFSLMLVVFTRCSWTV